MIIIAVMKTMKTKAARTKVNETMKTKITNIKTKVIEAKERVNSKTRIFIIIFIIKEFYEKHASTRK